MKNSFSENCWQILGECLVYFIINYLLPGLLVPYNEMLSPCLLRMVSPYFKTSDLVFHGKVLASG